MDQDEQTIDLNFLRKLVVVPVLSKGGNSSSARDIELIEKLQGELRRYK